MSRSTRYTPICGWTTARSEKHDKRIANRRFRRKTRLAIHHEREPPTRLRQVSNIWDFDKDGKQWIGNGPEQRNRRRGRTDTEWWYRIMRK